MLTHRTLTAASFRIPRHKWAQHSDATPISDPPSPCANYRTLTAASFRIQSSRDTSFLAEAPCARVRVCVCVWGGGA